MTAAEDLRVTASCSFCLKVAADVDTMVAGPGVFICNECICICDELIANKPKTKADNPVESWERKFSDDELLEHLPKVAATSALVEQQLNRWVDQARSRGITWTRIGQALGMTRQSAWERFSGED
jgi:hypothetical protein